MIILGIKKYYHNYLNIFFLHTILWECAVIYIHFITEVVYLVKPWKRYYLILCISNNLQSKNKCSRKQKINFLIGFFLGRRKCCNYQVKRNRCWRSHKSRYSIIEKAHIQIIMFALGMIWLQYCFLMAIIYL